MEIVAARRNARTQTETVRGVMDKTRALYLPAAESRRAEDGKGIGAEALHARYLDDVFRYVSRRLPRREEAEDVTAEVFEAALTALPGYRGKAHPYVWLLGIARRKIIDVGRRRRTRRETFVSEMAVSDANDAARRDEPEVFMAAGPGPEARVLEAERLETIRELVNALKEEQREALLLQHVERLSIAEIAEVMGRSPAAVNSLLQRARATLFQRGRVYFLDEVAQ